MKDLTINLNANEASGEAYWRKRCDAVEAEIMRLRAVNAELVEALKKIARGVDCPEGIIKRPDFYASQDYFEHIAIDALSRAEQAKPETCVWEATPCGWHQGCSVGTDTRAEVSEFCPDCGNRIEVKE